MIEVQNLTVRFGVGKAAMTAVDNVSFTVKTGEAFGLVGESGCGKTTILRALAGLNSNWEGTIRIDGKQLTPKRERAFYKLAQIVFQDPYGSLHPRFTVNGTLMEPIKIHGLDRADERIDRVLKQVGLGPAFRFRYPHQLSGGQRQRVAIARALILEPKLMLLDEPTSALDVSVQAEILNLLTDIRDSTGLTFLLVSHDLSVVSHMCDRLAVMNHGKIYEELTVEDLVERRYREAYTRQLFEASLGYDKRLTSAQVAKALDEAGA